MCCPPPPSEYSVWRLPEAAVSGRCRPDRGRFPATRLRPCGGSLREKSAYFLKSCENPLSLSSRFIAYASEAERSACAGDTARMAESVDALVSNTNDSNVVPVRPRLRVQMKTSGQSFFDCPEVSFLPFCDGIRGRGHFAAGPDRFRFGVRRTMRVQKEVSIKFTGD